MSESWDFSVSADLNADKSESGQSETWLVLFDHVYLTPETGHLIDDSGTAEMCQWRTCLTFDRWPYRIFSKGAHQQEG
jgi:hypothetical protein